MSAKNFSRFSVTSAWKNSSTRQFGSRSDWPTRAAWPLPLSVNAPVRRVAGRFLSHGVTVPRELVSQAALLFPFSFIPVLGL